MAIAVVAALATPLLSIGWMAGVAFLPQLTLLKLQLFCEGFDTNCVIDAQATYVLIACFALFALGLLAWFGVFSTASGSSGKQQP